MHELGRLLCILRIFKITSIKYVMEGLRNSYTALRTEFNHRNA